jgi:isopropylmalate/homocitrate/citramalate synthase
MGVANAVSAWLFGASAVNCSLLGIGERTGNVPTEAMVMQYASLRGTLDGMDTTAITDIAEYFKKELKYDIPPMTPFVGSAFNLTRAGVHADGMMKDAEIYNIFDTGAILNRPAGVTVSSTSGAAGIAYWINSHYRLTGDEMISKKDPLVAKIKAWVDEQYADGRQTVISTAELEKMIVTFRKEEE